VHYAMRSRLTKQQSIRARQELKRGSVVFGEFPSDDGEFLIGMHPLVVLGVYSWGALVMFCTSKQLRNCPHLFSDEECYDAQFWKKGRFNPERVAVFKRSDFDYLRPTRGCLGKDSVDRMVLAAKTVNAVTRIFSRRLQVK
jgi:hypothetical protein